MLTQNSKKQKVSNFPMRLWFDWRKQREPKNLMTKKIQTLRCKMKMGLLSRVQYSDINTMERGGQGQRERGRCSWSCRRTGVNWDKRFLFICGKEGHHTVLALLCLCLVDSCCCLPLLGYAGLNHYSVKGLPLIF